MGSAPPNLVPALLIGTGGCVCALPLDRVVETMRPLPTDPLQGCPDYVAGVAVIRGEPIPVVTLSALTGDPAAAVRRFVTLRTGGRRVALAVERVIGVRRLEAARLAGAPPLLGGMRPDIVSHLGVLDGTLLMVLETGRLLPETGPEAGPETAASGSARP